MYITFYPLSLHLHLSDGVCQRPGRLNIYAMGLGAPGLGLAAYRSIMNGDKDYTCMKYTACKQYTF